MFGIVPEEKGYVNTVHRKIRDREISNEDYNYNTYKNNCNTIQYLASMDRTLTLYYNTSINN